MKYLLLIIFLFVLQPGGFSQPCSGPGRTPQSAFPVCGTVVFNQPGVTNCQGSQYPNFECLSGINTSNSMWYSFTCYEPGLLAFLITPQNPADDYDWILMDVTGRTPAQILSNDYSISLNYSGVAGTTGCTADGVGEFNCPGSPRYNSMPFLQEGHDYMLMVTNFSQSGFGYSISFDGSTANLSNDVNPFITDVSVVGCNTSQLKVTFSEFVLCSSIADNAANFTITNGVHTITSVASACDEGNIAVKEIYLNLQQPLIGGTYNLIVSSGILDVCHGPVQPISIPFNVPPQIPITITDISYQDCNATVLRLILNKPIQCSSISNNFREFNISPGTHSIAAVSSSCNANNSLSDTLILHLNTPMSLGNYQLTITNGADGNTIIDSCGVGLVNGYTVPFSIQPRPAPVIDSVKYDICSPDLLTLYYNTPIKCNSISSNGSDYFITGPSIVNVVSANAGEDCGSVETTHTVVLTLDERIQVPGNYALGIKIGNDGNTLLDSCSIAQSTTETISFNTLLKPSAQFQEQLLWGCSTDTIMVSHNGAAAVTNWQWTFNNGITSNGPTATAYFPATTAEASVQLIVSNASCADTLIKTYVLNNAFTTGFTIQSDSFCIDKPLQIQNVSSGLNLQYNWQFGDGTSSAAQHPALHYYTTAGEYMLTLNVSNNHGCSIDSIKRIVLVDTAQVAYTGLLPRYCTADSIKLSAQVSGSRVLEYTWNNGNGIIIKDQPNVSFIYSHQKDYIISLTAKDSFCGDNTYTNIVSVYQTPEANLGNDISICPDFVRTIGLEPMVGHSYLWNTGATDSKIITGHQSMLYSITVENNGCTKQDDLYVRIADTCLLKVPTAFTPNNDGLNDRLKVINAELVTNFSLKVYNRYGQLVFVSSNPLNGWDGFYKGQPAEAGVYVWQTSYINNYSKKPVYEKGTTLLIR